jgi:hypothetical protein
MNIQLGRRYQKWENKIILSEHHRRSTARKVSDNLYTGIASSNPARGMPPLQQRRPRIESGCSAKEGCGMWSSLHIPVNFLHDQVVTPDPQSVSQSVLDITTWHSCHTLHCRGGLQFPIFLLHISKKRYDTAKITVGWNLRNIKPHEGNRMYLQAHCVIHTRQQ